MVVGIIGTEATYNNVYCFVGIGWRFTSEISGFVAIEISSDMQKCSVFMGFGQSITEALSVFVGIELNGAELDIFAGIELNGCFIGVYSTIGKKCIEPPYFFGLLNTISIE